MTVTEAKQLLLVHSIGERDKRHPSYERGFIASLRPYRGQLFEESFHEIMAALRVLAPSLHQPTVDREVVSALWSICDLARSYGLRPDGVLQRDGLISEADIKRLDLWVSCISSATQTLLWSGSIDSAFNQYERLVA